MDAELITGLQQNSEAAFKQVYRLYHKKLYAYFLHKTRSADISGEGVQVTFIKLWRFRHKLDTGFALSRQVFRIAKTCMIDLLRQKAGSRVVELKPVMQEEIIDDALSATDNHRIALVKQSLEQLPPMRRKILSFRLEGMSNKEIAGTLDISQKTVENQVNRAIHDIRKDNKILQALRTYLFTLFF